jgi:hypothetical protein
MVLMVWSTENQNDMGYGIRNQAKRQKVREDMFQLWGFAKQVAVLHP